MNLWAVLSSFKIVSVKGSAWRCLAEKMANTYRLYKKILNLKSENSLCVLYRFEQTALKKNNMNWNAPDSLPDETENEYEYRKRKESESSTGVLFGIMQLLFFIVKIVAIFGVFIYLGFLLSKNILGDEADSFKLWGFSIFFTYLIFCVIYFLKGTTIGLKTKNRKLWLLPWLICVLLCCVVPAFIVKTFVVSLFSLAERDSLWCIGISWGAFILSSFYMYNIYQFKTPTAPKIFYWAYTLGLKISS